VVSAAASRLIPFPEQQMYKSGEKPVGRYFGLPRETLRVYAVVNEDSGREIYE